MHDTLNAVFYIATFVLIVMTRTSAKDRENFKSVGRYPYITSIQNRYLEKYCTGTIVTNIHVLSTFSCACHYNYNATESDGEWICYDPGSFIVVAGVSGKYMDFSAGQVRGVEKFIVTNDSYYPPDSTHFADFAILLLKTPFIFKASVQQMFLYEKWEKDRIKAALIKASPAKNHLHNCSTVGWDFITGSETVSMLTVLPTQLTCKCNFDYCDKNPNQSYCVPYCEQPNICGTFRTDDIRYCGGLTGNLLICGGESQISHTVVGLASVPASCSDSRKRVPTVYVRMDAMLGFLREIRASNSLSLFDGRSTYFIILSVIIAFYNYTYYCYITEHRACITKRIIPLKV